MVDLIELPNYISSTFQKGTDSKILFSYEGKKVAVLHGSTSSMIRNAKRTVSEIRPALAEIPLKTYLAVLQAALPYYFDKQTDFETVSKLSGSPISFVKEEMGDLKMWGKNITDYISLCFGSENYEKIPIRVAGKLVAQRIYIPKAPVTVVLPQNDDGLALYVLSQVFLSKNPAIVKPSSSGASAFSTIRFVEALNLGIDAVSPNNQILKKSIQVVNILDEDSEKKIQATSSLVLDKGQLVVFGSSRTVSAIASEASKHVTISNVIKMGTGFSISIVLSDANIANAVKEIIHSITQDKANKCTTTNVVYVSEEIYSKFLSMLSEKTQNFTLLDPLHEDSKFGLIDEATKRNIHSRFKELYGTHKTLRMVKDQLHPTLHELEPHEHVEEFSGPIVAIKKIGTLENFVTHTRADIYRNDLEKNLVTSIYTADSAKCEFLASRLPSHTFKLNTSSEKKNFLLEHQGNYLLKELMDSRVLELY